MVNSVEPALNSGAVPEITARLSLKEKISYGLGDLGNGFMFDLGQAYLLKFYTDVAGLPATVAGEIFIITKIFDAFMDPVAGSFVDGRSRIGRHGRFKPVMFYSSIALAVLTVFIFTTPGASQNVNLAYAYITYMAWGVLYSFTNVPYGSLSSVMTQNAGQRSQLASFRQAGSVTALLVTGVAFMPIVLAFGTQRIGFPVAAAIMALIGVLAFFGTFRGTQETVRVARTEKLTLRGFATTVRTNRPLQVLVLMTLFSISAYNIKTMMIAYYTEYVLGDISLLPYINFISIGCSVIGILSIPYLCRRFGKKNTALIGFAIAAVADGLNFLTHTNLVTFTLLLSVSFIGVALPNGVVWALVSDAIDFGHWRTGVRREGIVYSMFNFSRKLAQSIAGGLAGFGLGYVGYVANETQTAATQTGMKELQMLFPCVAFMVAAAVLFFLYPLTDERVTSMVTEIHQREDHQREDGAGTTS
ncbi:glycoside-pentoside-hexuronide (GPH):cation symporter [Kineosporia sp. J2-2]|uniref:Glycoside-pentoside-hexuronide (GPH):cation symporter n=1 Tax=Kineosporia corallincola TaxID=2835133 RepID=A0ABS5TRD1_9ACTN|nr:glycoside-pentoside-hexuronide (GPH):cation symporter [Kineosporia corallincola]MBT0773348.1 glycoside-pentoside-hexuronide (GPH):cation symporter [Kineosporia corallincola]